MHDKKYLPQLIFFVLVYVLVFFLLGVTGIINSLDGFEHRAMALDSTRAGWYAPLFRTVSFPFAFDDFTWWLFVSFVFVGLTAYFVYKLSGVHGAFVLFTSTYFFTILGSGLFAQAFCTLLVLIFLNSKNNLNKLILLLGIWLSHDMGWAITLFLLIGSIVLFAWNKAKVLLFCSPVFGNYSNSVLDKDISLASPTFGNVWVMTWRGLFSFLIKGMSFPFLFFGLKGLLKKKDYLVLGLILFGLFGAFYQNIRVLLFVMPFVCIGFGLEWNSLKHKHLWTFFIWLMILYQWFNFFVLRWLC